MAIEVDKKSGTVVIKLDGTYTADQLLELIQSLGSARAQIHQEPFQPAPETKISLADGWGFWTQIRDGHSLVALRHPGYGWVANKIPIASAAQLAGTLHQQAIVLLASAVAELNQRTTAALSTRADVGPGTESGGGSTLH